MESFNPLKQKQKTFSSINFTITKLTKEWEFVSHWKRLHWEERKEISLNLKDKESYLSNYSKHLKKPF